MAYIVHKGKVLHSDDFDLLENYAAEHKTKVVSVEVWPFEQLSIGQLCVRWRNGAIGNFVGGDARELRTYVESLDGWPIPVVFSRSLPRSAGLMYLSATNNEEAKAEEIHATKRVVRERHGEVVRRRRVRAEN